MVLAIVTTLKTAVWALLLLFFAIYIFGICIAQLCAAYFKRVSENPELALKDEESRWLSLFASFVTLFMSINGGIDWEHAYNPLLSVGAGAGIGPLAAILYIFYLLFAHFCV